MRMDALDWAAVSIAAVAAAYCLRRYLSSPSAPAPPSSSYGNSASNKAKVGGGAGTEGGAAEADSGGNERNVAEKMKKSGKNCVIFFGSQTGTAEEYASRLAREARKYSFKAMTADLKDYDADSIKELAAVENALVIFCVATYGEGEPTDNARDFSDWLKEAVDTKSTSLQGVRYTVFGLGNKTYEHFNAMARTVDKGLKELGADRVFEHGEGDDDANLEDDFTNWKDRMWSAVCVAFNVQAGDDQSFRQYSMQVHENMSADRVFLGEVATLKSFVTQKRPFNAQNPLLATVLVNRELYTDGARSCRHIELDISNSGVRYAAGDHVAVYPVNSESLVQRLATRLNLNLDMVLSLLAVDETAKKRHPFPCPCTLGTALRHYVDLAGKPSAYLVREMAAFATAEEDRALLQRIVKNPEEFHEWVTNNERNIVDILEDVPSARPPIDYLMELLPRLQPRYYSISSSPKAFQTSIHVTAAVVRHKSKLGRSVEGVATTYLAGMQPGDKVPIFVRQSSFRLPVDPKMPVIMVGPGTGLAPFRGFIQERVHAKKAGKPVGETMLFFGCQNRAHHFLYGDELERALSEGALTHLSVAASRDQPEKIYVQHHIAKEGETIFQLLSRGAYIYICGDARHMAHDVQAALEQVLVQYGQRPKEQAAEYFKAMKTKRRYQMDVWS